MIKPSSKLSIVEELKQFVTAELFVLCTAGRCDSERIQCCLFDGGRGGDCCVYDPVVCCVGACSADARNGDQFVGTDGAASEIGRGACKTQRVAGDHAVGLQRYRVVSLAIKIFVGAVSDNADIQRRDGGLGRGHGVAHAVVKCIFA